MWGSATKGFLSLVCIDFRPASHLWAMSREQTWLRMWGWTTEGLFSPVCTDSRLASHWNGTYKWQIWLRMWGWATEGFFYRWYALIPGQPHICELRTYDRLDLECEAGPLKVCFHWYIIPWFQSSPTSEWMWGWVTEGFLSLVCTDSRPASHLWATWRTEDRLDIECEAGPQKAFFITGMHWL